MSQAISAYFEIPGFHLKQLNNEDVVALQAFLERSPEYSQLATGSLPAPSAANMLLIERPEGKKPNDKFLFGIYTQNQRLIGVLDAVRDYPNLHDWWVGLLLFDPPHRGQGLGKRVFQAFEKWVINQGAHRICLGVIEENRRAYQFWQKVGCQHMERRIAKLSPNVDHVVIVMARILTK